MRFPFLIARPGSASIETYLEKAGKQARDYFITYHDQLKFQLWDSLELFLQHMQTVPAMRRNYHEVIVDGPQKLKFDIDAEINDLAQLDDLVMGGDADTLADSVACLGEGSPTFLALMSIIVDTIYDIFYTTYDMDPDLIICESSPVDEALRTKYSAHIIIANCHVSSAAQARAFTNKIYETLPHRCRPFLDTQINKRNSMFRAAGCTKMGEMRPKRIRTRGYTAADTFITNVAATLLLDDITEDLPVVHVPHIANTNQVMEICAAAGLLRDHSYRACRGGLYIFNRINASQCRFCAREHKRDHTCVVSVLYRDDTASVYEQCRKYNSEHPNSINNLRLIGTFTGAVPDGHEVKSGSEFVERVCSAAVDPMDADDVGGADVGGMGGTADNDHAGVIGGSIGGRGAAPDYHQLPAAQLQVYCEPTMRHFELVPTLVVHAPMKIGKTNELCNYIATNFTDTNLTKHVIRFVSFRQTFSNNIKEKLPEFKMYNDTTATLSQPRLIVQVESLHRVKISPDDEPPDLLVLDECESIFEQFGSGLIRQFSQVMATFAYLMRFSKHVVCMDANISSRTYRCLEAMRQHPIHYHHNTYQNATEQTYFITESSLKWLGLLYHYIDAGDRIAIPTSSLETANTVAQSIRTKYPLLKVMVYSSEVSMSEKRTHFSDVNAYWSKFDIIIYTPTVSAGVSFERPHFDKVFGYFTDMSCPVETCIQMMGRIRNIASAETYLYVSSTGGSLPTEPAEIVEQFYTRRASLFANAMDTVGLWLEYDAAGKIVHHTTPYFTIWVENIRIKNLSKNAFLQRLVRMIRLTGAAIQYVSQDVFSLITGLNVEQLAVIGAEHADAHEQMTVTKCEAIALADEIDDEEFESIGTELGHQGDVAPGRKHSYAKYKLRRNFQFPHPIDAIFVRKYMTQNTRAWYRNLMQLRYGSEEDLGNIKTSEQAAYRFTMELEMNAQFGDITRKYMYVRHTYAVGMLRLCGWKSLYDRAYISTATIRASALDNSISVPYMPRVCKEFDINKYPMFIEEDPSSIESIIALTSAVLYKMYGARIHTERGNTGMRYIALCPLFAYGVANTVRPYINYDQI